MKDWDDIEQRIAALLRHDLEGLLISHTIASVTKRNLVKQKFSCLIDSYACFMAAKECNRAFWQAEEKVHDEEW